LLQRLRTRAGAALWRRIQSALGRRPLLPQKTVSLRRHRLFGPQPGGRRLLHRLVLGAATGGENPAFAIRRISLKGTVSIAAPLQAGLCYNDHCRTHYAATEVNL